MISLVISKAATACRCRWLYLSVLLFIVLISTNGLGQTCTHTTPQSLCYSNETPMAGHGAVSSTDNRRIINIGIDSSWDQTAGNTNAQIWNAVQCAINQWNSATDGYNNKTGYYFVVNQSSSSKDITIVKGTTTGGAGYAETLINPAGGPDTIPKSGL